MRKLFTSLLLLVTCSWLLVLPVFADEGFVFTFFGTNIVTGYSFKQLEDLRKARGGTAPIPVTVRITPEGLAQNPNLISELEGYSYNLHLQINYQVDFWHSPTREEINKIVPELKKITTPGNTITLGVEYHFFYELKTYPDFVRQVLDAGVSAPLISTNFNITNPSGPHGPNGNYMYSFQESISYLAQTCPECLTSMSEIAISNYQDDTGSWINEIYRVRKILAGVGLGLENKPLRIVEAGSDPNKGSFQERIQKAINLANQLTNYFKNNPEEFKNLNITGITFLIHDAATGKIAMLVMNSEGQWQLLYFFAGMGPVQFKGITLQKWNHPGPPFEYHKNIIGLGLQALFGGNFLATLRHLPPETKITDWLPSFQKTEQAFKHLTPSSLKEKLVFDELEKTDKVRLSYISCDEGEGLQMSGGEFFNSQPGLLHYLGKDFFLNMMQTSQELPNLNPNREENNFQVVASEGFAIGHPQCDPELAGLGAKPHPEDSEGESQIKGPVSIFAKFLGTVKKFIEGVLNIFDEVAVVVKGQSFFTTAYHQPQAESYSQTLKTFIPKEAAVPEGCSTTKNNVRLEISPFSQASGSIQAEACSPEGEEAISAHDTTMKFLLPKNLSPYYQSPWQEEEI